MKDKMYFTFDGKLVTELSKDELNHLIRELFFELLYHREYYYKTKLLTNICKN